MYIVQKLRWNEKSFNVSLSQFAWYDVFEQYDKSCSKTLSFNIKTLIMQIKLFNSLGKNDLQSFLVISYYHLYIGINGDKMHLIKPGNYKIPWTLKYILSSTYDDIVYRYWNPKIVSKLTTWNRWKCWQENVLQWPFCIAFSFAVWIQI